MSVSLSDDGPSAGDDRLRDIVDRLEQGETGEALDRLKPLLAVETPSLPARFVLAMTAWRLERFDWCLSLLRQYHAEAPNNGGIAEALASLHAQLGHLEDSLFTAKLATALGNDPVFAALTPKDYPGFDRAFLSIVENPLLGKARKALANGKRDRAIEFARQHVAIEPDQIDGRAFYAECLLSAGLAGTAVETLGVIADTAPAARTASLYARALSGVGERQAAIDWHREAATGAPEDATIAAAHLADAPFLGVEISDIERLSRDWLAGFGLSPKPARKYGAGGKLVIGYLVSAFIDPDDAIAVGATAQAHDRDRATVLGFGIGGQTAKHNALLVGAFTKWRDIGALDPATLARTFSGDGVDILIDAGGFASAQQLQALTRCDNALRVSWLGNPTGIVAPLYDVRLGAADYPVIGARLGRPAPGEGPVAFGADVRVAQFDSATVALWSAVLDAVPDAKLVLRARDMDCHANVARLVACFGQSVAARIDLRRASDADEFYQTVDIALLPLCGASPRAAAEALASGVPAIAMAGEPYGTFLAGRGLGKRLVAENAVQYRAIAVAMAQSLEARTLPPIERGAARLARAIEELAASLNRQENAA